MFFTHTPMCVSTVYSVLSPSPVQKIIQPCYSGGLRTQDPCYSRAVSYQLDYRGCPNYVKKFSNTNYLIWWKNIKGYAPEVSGIQAPVQLMAHTGPSPLPYRTLQDLHPTQSTSPLPRTLATTRALSL